MKNIHDKKQETEQSHSKAEWNIPVLTVISMDKTNSGTRSSGANEGTFYAPVTS